MSTVEIEPLQRHHVAEVLEIEKTLFANPWTRSMFEHEIAARPASEGPGTYAVVATVEGCVVGYAVAWFIDEGVHLMNIAVRKEFQRRGIGKRLLAYLIERAWRAGKRFIVLEVRRSNLVAQAFYRSFLFERVGVRPGYYADNGEDAILMALDLSSGLPRKSGGAKRGEPKRS